MDNIAPEKLAREALYIDNPTELHSEIQNILESLRRATAECHKAATFKVPIPR